MELTEKIMYEASYSKDVSFEGIFWMGVKTTGIFCRPTCTARKPKFENVEFFFNTKDAMLKGYRPCKVCRPLENLDATPQYIKELLKEIADDPTLKLKDYDLVKRGLEPATVRRWFLKHHGITFHAFQRMSKLNTAFKKLRQGESVTEVAYDTGYDSLSGFNEGFKNIFGVSPKNTPMEKVIDLKRIETMLGTMIACADEHGICLLEFSDRKALPTELKSIAEYFKANIIQGENPHFITLEEELKEYFEGKRTRFSVPLSLVGTDFQKQVWKVLQEIPYGTTRTYQEQADILGNRKSVRAVANANGLNKISIIIPCHRVIGSNGHLTGYGGGIWRKQKLLELERAILF
ncbi:MULTISPECIES: bifunctional transcriptional activator/DNA repair enzyme AdaA [Chryseobacterium]|uniref:Methylated-DNA--protein-cysteine methyltransferase n=1 Tax=Chryseobacterium camelliae TaxID=1265445 RepID=A0ABU0TEQ5_9FLAO|nr:MULTISPECIES: bifunctional transcriptional activator/DNA repair protein Ada [Chryseobacterium]MDT3406653.1 AraC family transcriptional regulator of adaptative response/methylated-DNA-[protein]-cysteine methyltransferase [Pseudacidovorax intermedius]MDQ1095549.1 AraC family transcriptional regulator of adaptative response/methylated-DNA-[protein]-cysteine methyltransferase [Chryseobacterium camelliae]MDQ1099487.1 AraC family transcriptional regulator of adaptative response/methylated-DNA-[prot